MVCAVQWYLLGTERVGGEQIIGNNDSVDKDTETSTVTLKVQVWPSIHVPCCNESLDSQFLRVTCLDPWTLRCRTSHYDILKAVMQRKSWGSFLLFFDWVYFSWSETWGSVFLVKRLTYGFAFFLHHFPKAHLISLTSSTTQVFMQACAWRNVSRHDLVVVHTSQWLSIFQAHFSARPYRYFSCSLHKWRPSSISLYSFRQVGM